MFHPHKPFLTAHGRPRLATTGARANPDQPTRPWWRTGMGWWRAANIAAWTVIAIGATVNIPTGWLADHAPSWSSLLAGSIVATIGYMRRRQFDTFHEVYWLGIVAGVRLRKQGVTEEQVIQLPRKASNMN